MIVSLVAAWFAPWFASQTSASAAAKDEADDDRDEAVEDVGVYLPTDRLTERRLDFARRLIADTRWSDAATLLDEILAADRDSFFRRDIDASTWQSAKVEAARLIGSLPPEGRAAYELQFRARADRLLQEAIAAGDSQAITAVARRWLNTPAGRRATLLAAIEALTDGQPLAAAAWLDRLAAADAAEFEPTLSVMRAVAWQRAGNPQASAEILEKARTLTATTTRLGGRDASVSFTPGGGLEWLAGAVGGLPAAALRTASEWRMHRGDPARNAVAEASRPLLVPRYRVPLTRHPEEAKWLEERRKRAADQDAPLLPAAAPLAVDGTVVLHTAMGLLAVDFETGKRLWLQTAGAAAPIAIGEEAVGDDGEPLPTGDASRRQMLAPVFEDSTSGTLASDGRLVFAVESHPDAIASLGQPGMKVVIGPAGPAGGIGGWTGGNSLAAYDLAGHGRLTWRVPAAEGGQQRSTAWTLGPPLPVGDRLFVLVEESGEVRLDVLDATTGSTVWSQPLAELDEESRVDNRDNQRRRVAGLSPALSEGVLVCPTGAGTVVSVDLATRTLLWAYNYAVARHGDVIIMPNGVRVARPGRLMPGRVIIDGQPVELGAAGRWLDGCPVLAHGRAILTPDEADEMHCVDLRSGRVEWKRPRQDGLYVAGVVNRRLVVVGRRSVEAVSLDSGELLWSTPLTGQGAAISGRSLLDQDRLFVPLDTPEVVEIELDKGGIVGRSAGRGGAVPGNLVAYRGEVLSQGVDSFDVFHQTAPLGSRIETALDDSRGTDGDALLLMWRGQLRLDSGAIEAGLDDLQKALVAAPDRFPPDTLAEAMVFAMERNESVAGSMWPSLLALEPPANIARRGLRRAIDGLVRAGDLARAWEACQHLLELPRASAHDELVADVDDPLLTVRAERWVQARIADIDARGGDEVRGRIAAFARARLDAIRRLTDAPSAEAAPLDALDSLIEHFGRHPVAIEARRERVTRMTRTLAAGRLEGDAMRTLTIRREFALIDLLHGGGGDDRRLAEVELARVKTELGGLSGTADAAWPIGRIAVRSGSGHPEQEQGRVAMHRSLPLDVEVGDDALLPGVRLEYDLKQGGLVVRDDLGRRIGGPITLEDRRPFGLGGFNAASTEACLVGRVAVLRSGGFIAAYELAAPTPLGSGSGHRRLWAHEGSDAPHLLGGRRAVNRRFPRDVNVPLGMQIPEPEMRGTPPPDGPARVSGVPVLVSRSLQLRDPIDGSLIWERHRLPEVDVIVGDDEYLCVCPADGRGALVISMATGRTVRVCDLPPRGQRLLSHGRSIFVVTPQTAAAGAAPGRAAAAMVDLDALDPVDMRRVRLGSFSGDSRLTTAGDALAILEPTGAFTVVDMPGRRVTFATRLPEMPRMLERLFVLPWQDRYLVIAGRAQTAEETRQLERIGTIGPLPQNMANASHQPLTGAIWAVDRLDGEMLWPVPATVLQHCLAPHQPAALPVLLFARQIATRRGGERPRLSILCLDKRTGAPVHVDDTILVAPHMLSGCDMEGDPDRHVIHVAPTGLSGNAIDIEFTGEPMAPQPPFQATSRPVVAGDIGTELEYWWQQLLTLPLPF